MLEHAELTGEIIGAAIEVHRELGPGYLEAFYARALEIELRERQIPFERELIIPIVYKGRHLGEHKLDLLVARTIVVELKAVRAIERIHYAIASSYLRAAQLEHGLILNFASAPLIAKRVISKQ